MRCFVNFGGENGKKPYESPSVKQLTIQQARSYMARHGRELLDLIFPSRKLGNGNGPAQQPASYQTPRLTKLTPEQAKLKLLGHLSLGDRGAKDLLDLLFPEPGTTAFDSPEHQPALTRAAPNASPLRRTG